MQTVTVGQGCGGVGVVELVTEDVRALQQKREPCVQPRRTSNDENERGYWSLVRSRMTSH